MRVTSEVPVAEPQSVQRATERASPGGDPDNRKKPSSNGLMVRGLHRADSRRGGARRPEPSASGSILVGAMIIAGLVAAGWIRSGQSGCVVNVTSRTPNR